MLQEEIRTTGAVVMGRHSYDMAEGDLTGYEYQVPIFVLTHHIPEDGSRQTWVAYRWLRVESEKVEVEHAGGLPPSLLRPASIESLDL